MTNVNLVLKLKDYLATKLFAEHTNLENGVLLFYPTIRVECIALIVAWSALNMNEDIEMGSGNGGQGGGDNHYAEDEARRTGFIQFVLLHNRTVLIELAEAAIVLQLWSLFELCCKTMANLIIKLNTVTEAQLALGIPNYKGTKLSMAVIQGFLKYLPFEKRLEMDTTEVSEWQLASKRVWSEVKVLFFGSGGESTFASEQCEHEYGDAIKLNYVKCTEADLEANINHIYATHRRKVPDKFLRIIRKCVNLETLIWDQDFGQMADTKLARVLDQSCPHLKHIEGFIEKDICVKKSDLSMVISPTSFIDVFKPSKNITCFNLSCNNDLQLVDKVEIVPSVTVNTGISMLSKRTANSHFIPGPIPPKSIRRRRVRQKPIPPIRIVPRPILPRVKVNV